MKNVIIVLLTLGYAGAVLCVESDASFIQKLFNQVERPHIARGGFTQTTAQMSLKSSQQKIKSELSGFVEHSGIIRRVLDRESEYKRRYDVFYTVQPCSRLLSDVMRELYIRQVGAVGALKTDAFQFLRFSYQNKQYDQFADTPHFMKYALLRDGVIFDGYDNKHMLVPADISLFGNPGLGIHTTWMKFVKPPESCHADHVKKQLKDQLTELLASYGHSATYVDKLLQLDRHLVNPHGDAATDLTQIFIPEHLTKSQGYLSWYFGVPFDHEFIAQLSDKEHVKEGGSLDSHKRAIVDFSRRFKRSEGAVVSAVQTLVNEVLAGKFDLEQSLYQYRTDPEKFTNFSYLQARLLVTNSVLLNPTSGVLIYRYSSLDPQKEAQYKTDLERILLQMDIEKQARDYIRK